MYSVNIPDLLTDTEDIIRLFFKDYKRGQSLDFYIHQNITFDERQVKSVIKTNLGGESVFYDSAPFSYTKGSLEYTKYLKRFVKNALYKVLKQLTGQVLPWGSLTGVHPTKLAYELLDGGIDLNQAAALLKQNFDISDRKLKLLTQIIDAQKGIYKKDENAVNLYINIPVCQTRCSYCSFISSELNKCSHLLNAYSKLLSQEIKYCLELIKKKNMNIRSVYVGGGTPTSIGTEQLELILSAAPKDAAEFTVEAGRPDSITKEKLDLLKNQNVTRISINPQSFNQEVIDAIGRGHTVKDIYNAYELARKDYNFIINMDLIAGLPKDSYESFCDTIHKTLELEPENITVHTLCLKSGADLKRKPIDQFADVSQMVDYAYDRITQKGYTPYYVYRQKYMIGNLENTGYCKPKTQCVHNIDTMEESVSVIACGAGAISKRIKGGKIKRSANVKFIEDYISRFDEMLLRHDELFFEQN
ncbi:MAG TPA: coproporphyrinogen dehydrogenase HemZ [Clostridia bacterium]